ncbi:hypothetical protein G9F71_004715 [Clostridium sp. FP2]|uniref:hypothetical protein n=1 Tax=Clostridium sp. FP2 TaxID=2724481 RepID=UPI0013E92E02|nr:hypothetical protein [Clostridium sp. FP2]MBZ9622162.1 hypothetical protein [Clostridium sp. FP2]
MTQKQLVDEFNGQYGYAFTKTTISQYENNKRIPEVKFKIFYSEAGIPASFIVPTTKWNLR